MQPSKLKKPVAPISLLLVCLFLSACSALAQDVITKKNGDVLKVKIVEVGTSEVKYRLPEAPEGPVIVISRSDIKSIKVEGKNGQTVNLIDEKADPMGVTHEPIIAKASAVKFNFFSPIYQNLAFSYEQVIHPGYNAEIGLGLVGPGIGSNSYDPHGLYLKAGIKFLLGNVADVEDGKRLRYSHPLKGRYIKLEASFWDESTSQQYQGYYVNGNGGYGTNYPFQDYTISAAHQGWALMFIYGRQFILANMFTFGYYIGIGYTGENTQYTSNVNPIPAGTSASYIDNNRYGLYSFTTGSEPLPIGITGGINLGYIFKTPSWLTPKGSHAPTATTQPDHAATAQPDHAVTAQPDHAVPPAH